MRRIIFTEEYCKPANLHPFTLTRHLQDIRVGILTIREKWEKLLGLPSFNKWEDHYLDGPDSLKIDRSIGSDTSLLVHANVLPTRSILTAIKKLKHGEFLSAGPAGGIAFAFSQQEVAGLHKIKVTRLVEYAGELKIIAYPWDIVQLNDWAIREDFNLVTRGRKSAPVSRTTKLINPGKIFIEKGARLSHCIINAEEARYISVRTPTSWKGP
ncbi:MAG: hypothetical protein IPI66_15145 [Chitinophagaceae bacterium]|nr:hypothetical protein [Chitinophagaceae bacterium]